MVRESSYWNGDSNRNTNSYSQSYNYGNQMEMVIAIVRL